MKSAAILIALMGSSAVTALEPRMVKPLTGSSEVVVTRTVTVTTFQGAAPTHGNSTASRALHRTKSSGRKGPPRVSHGASLLEHMPSSHGVVKEIPEPSAINEALSARAPMPMVVMPTISVTSKIGTPAAQHRPGYKAHNGTFSLVHVTNHTATHVKGKSSDGMEDLKEWLKKIDGKVSDTVNGIQGTISNEADDVEDSVLSKATDLLSEAHEEDATSSI